MRISSLFASALSAAAAIAGIYAIATAIATPATSGFNNAEPTGRTTIVELGIAHKRAADEHRTARAKCETLDGAEKIGCQAEAKSAQIRARTAARAKYKGNVKTAAQTVVNGITNGRRDDSEPAVGLDIALYRAHKHWSDDRVACIGSEPTPVEAVPSKGSAHIAMRR